MRLVCILIASIAISLALFLPKAVAQNRDDWNEIKGDHFIVYYQGTGRDFADRVLHEAESYYNQIAAQLGYSRRSDFWLWENRCLLYLYETKEAFHQLTKQAEWSNGFAIPERRTIVSYLGSSEFIGSVLPHELAHLIFRDFVGVGNKMIPLWLDEGLAMAQERLRRPQFDQLVKEMISEKKWIPVQTMAQIRSMSDTSASDAIAFYAEAQSLVRFLLDAGEPNRFVQFCRDLRDSTSLEEALHKNYPKEFQTIDAFEKIWVEARA